MFAGITVNGMRFSVFAAKPTLPLPIVPNRELQVGLTVLALSLALSHGEREQITEVRPCFDSLQFVSSPTGRGNQITEVRPCFDSLQFAPSPTKRGIG